VWDRPTFCHARDPNEAWPVILEKAYAKLHGSYEALAGGVVHDALYDLTGGIPSFVDMGDIGAAASDGTLWQEIMSYHRAGYLLGAGTPEGSDSTVARGIAQGHAYAILDVKLVQGHQLLQLRNPWGRTEWNGEWGDAWIRKYGSNSVKRQLKWEDNEGTQVTDTGEKGDGVFWMEFRDFLVNFQTVQICRLFDKSWTKIVIHDQWKGLSATGCGNFKRLGDAPQYRIKILRPSHLIFVLSQQHDYGEENFAVGMGLQSVGGGRTAKSYKKNVKLSSAAFTNSRTSVMEADRMEPNTDGYTLVPTTFNPDEECTFVLAVWSNQSKIQVEAIPYDDPQFEREAAMQRSISQ